MESFAVLRAYAPSAMGSSTASRVAAAVAPLLSACLAAPGCVPSGGGLPAARPGEEEPRLEVTLNGGSCSPEVGPRQWLEVRGAETEGDLLWLRIRHSGCPGVCFALWAGTTIVETDPGLWEVAIEARAPEAPAACGPPRTELLRVDLSPSPVLRHHRLGRVSHVHEIPFDSTERRTDGDRRRDPRVQHVDVVVLPRADETAPLAAGGETPAPGAVAPSAECPHAAPTDESACVPPGAAACTYSSGGGSVGGSERACATVIATCRDGRWRVECLP